MRMNANEVMYTMGWDAFGLPTENYAIKVGKSPQEVAIANIKNFKRQVKMFGLSYDWDREINGVLHRAAIVATDYGSDTLVFLPEGLR